MAVLKWLLAILGLVLFGSAGSLVAYDVYVASELRRLLKRKSEGGARGIASQPARPFVPVRWQRVLQLALVALVPLLGGESMVRKGHAGPSGTWSRAVHAIYGSREAARLVRA